MFHAVAPIKDMQWVIMITGFPYQKFKFHTSTTVTRRRDHNSVPKNIPRTKCCRELKSKWQQTSADLISQKQQDRLHQNYKKTCVLFGSFFGGADFFGGKRTLIPNDGKGPGSQDHEAHSSKRSRRLSSANNSKMSCCCNPVETTNPS